MHQRAFSGTRFILCTTFYSDCVLHSLRCSVSAYSTKGAIGEIIPRCLFPSSFFRLTSMQSFRYPRVSAWKWNLSRMRKFGHMKRFVLVHRAFGFYSHPSTTDKCLLCSYSGWQRRMRQWSLFEILVTSVAFQENEILLRTCIKLKNPAS